MTHHNRRAEDVDRALTQRLDALERETRKLSVAMKTVTLEQGHMKELLSARLLLIERNQEIGNTKFDTLSQSILTMASDADKTPLGRAMLQADRALEASLTENADKTEQSVDTLTKKLDKMNDQLAERKLWQDRVDTVLYLLKWMGAGGLLALGYSILRILKFVP